ncbi:MAG: isoamylase [Treponema sp.]|jgi:hypothetical protein|nr:isoamylase [Treponema sp.]
MKTIMAVLLLCFIIGNIQAVDTESYQFINHLLNIRHAGAPEVFEDGVIFTAPSSYKRVGIAFAHEGFASVHWFYTLMKPDNDSEIVDAKEGVPYKDSGLLFYVYTVPEDIRELEYRLVINGLWTADPANPRYRIDGIGLTRSLITVPIVPKAVTTFDDATGTLNLRFVSEPGNSVTVAGSFNGWDPFMYPLQETSPGVYTLTLPLPPGTYYYVFFFKGERIQDPTNQNRVYTRDGKPASVAVIH